MRELKDLENTFKDLSIWKLWPTIEKKSRFFLDIPDY